MLFRSLVRSLIGNIFGACYVVACLNVSGVENLHGSADPARRYQTGAVSVIIPTFNNEPYIEQCVRSVMAQTYKNLEIIGINDGSMDKTEEIMLGLAQKDSRIRVISTPNRGVSHARNVGMDNAHGEFIYFLDGDDWISLDLIENFSSVLVQSGCNVARVSLGESLKKSALLQLEMHGVPTSFGYIVDTSNVNNRLFDEVWKYLYRHSFLDKYNLRFDEEISRVEDQPWTLKALVYARYIAICEKSACVYYRTNPSRHAPIPLEDYKIWAELTLNCEKDFAREQRVEHWPFVQKSIRFAEFQLENIIKRLEIAKDSKS